MKREREEKTKTKKAMQKDREQIIVLIHYNTKHHINMQSEKNSSVSSLSLSRFSCFQNSSRWLSLYFASINVLLAFVLAFFMLLLIEYEVFSIINSYNYVKII